MQLIWGTSSLYYWLGGRCRKFGMLELFFFYVTPSTSKRDNQNVIFKFFGIFTFVTLLDPQESLKGGRGNIVAHTSAQFDDNCMRAWPTKANEE